MKVAGAAIEHGFKMLADLPNGDSLVGYAQAGTVEPTALVDEDLRSSDLLPDTLQLAQSVFAGYYLRAFSMHNISIGNASVLQRLDKFSTRRSPTGAAVSSLGSIASAALEEFDDRLVVDGEVRELPAEIKELEEAVLKDAEASAERASNVEATPALESNDQFKVKGQQAAGKNTPQPTAPTNMKDAAKQAALSTLNGSSSASIGKTVDISDPVNLGVGRMINVTIKDNDREVQVPVLIRLNAMYMATAPLVHILASGSEDISFGARFKKWRLGGIDFWRDLVFCQDLIDTHKQNLRADKTGIYLQMMQKRRQNGLSAALSASLSANNASNIIIMSQASAEALEMKIYGKLKDFNTRQKLFQQGYGMLMFIIDKQWGRVRMYTRDIPEYTELSERDLKASSKGGGVDIGDVLNAFRAGSTPRL
ncbi:putative virion structural protein [Ralstonia phage RP31]|nr:putative virion structural protein [Ralstonia phage RP31]